MNPRLPVVMAAVAASSLLALAACQKAPPEPTPDPDTNKTQLATTSKAGGDGDTNGKTPAQTTPKGKKKISAKPTATVKVSNDDPAHGSFSLEEATKGLPAGKELSATIETDMGNIDCKLFDDKAPITVANFVGLARGLRPWKNPDGKWVGGTEKKAPAYDGTVFHRVIKGFMIQGGDPKKDGTGEPGYVIPDEIWEDANHDRAGLLCMANRGPNTNGQQFFITDDAAPHLDGGYTIFGECAPVDTIHKIAQTPGRGDRPTTPPAIKKVTINRK